MPKWNLPRIQSSIRHRGITISPRSAAPPPSRRFGANAATCQTDASSRSSSRRPDKYNDNQYREFRGNKRRPSNTLPDDHITRFQRLLSSGCQGWCCHLPQPSCLCAASIGDERQHRLISPRIWQRNANNELHNIGKYQNRSGLHNKAHTTPAAGKMK